MTPRAVRRGTPECSYCVKTGQKCPGYKDMFDLAWRDQTTMAQRSVERRKRASEKQPTKERPSESEAPAFASPSNPQEDLENYALTFWFTNYSNPPSKSYGECGFIEHVAPLFLKSGPQSTLRMSTLAVSTCLFTALSDRNPDTPLTRSFYLKAVSAMKQQLSTSIECVNNEMIISVLLLQMYEVETPR
jgi:hypothetical protein